MDISKKIDDARYSTNSDANTTFDGVTAHSNHTFEGLLVENKLREIRKERGLTLERACEVLPNITPGQLSRIERDYRNTTARRLEELAEGYGVTLSEVLGFDQAKVPVIGIAEAENWQTSHDLSKILKTVPRPPHTKHYKAKAIELKGDNLNQIFQSGTILFYVEAEEWAEKGQPIEDGNFAIVERKSFTGHTELSARQIKLSDDGELWAVNLPTDPRNGQGFPVHTPEQAQKQNEASNHSPQGQEARIVGIVISAYLDLAG